ncbi:MAG: stage V sporulation protein AB [Lachnospiraceae bacterium]|nr:stage V sporulation protein AB [Lachnospiraceae bacterium]
MLNDILIIAIFGLGAGAVTAGGYFAVVTSVGVVTRFAQYTNTADRIRLYESLIMTGAILGNILFVFGPQLGIWGGVLAVFGLFAGIFTGCFLMSLAETVKGVPIFIRRARLTTGLCILVIVLAVGKSLGSFFYFCFCK